MIFELTSTAFQGSAVTLSSPQILGDWSKYYNTAFVTLVLTGSIPPSREVFSLPVQSEADNTEAFESGPHWNNLLWGDKTLSCRMGEGGPRFLQQS